MKALVCAMLGVMSMGAASCHIVPNFHCGGALQYVQFNPLGVISSTCPEAMNYPGLLDDSDFTVTFLDDAQMQFGYFDRSKDGNVYSTGGDFDHATLHNATLRYIPLGGSYRNGVYYPGPLQAEVPLISYVRFHQNLPSDPVTWIWHAETQTWLAHDPAGTVVGYEKLEFEADPWNPVELLSYRHIEATRSCSIVYSVQVSCVSFDTNDDGLLPGIP